MKTTTAIRQPKLPTGRTALRTADKLHCPFVTAVNPHVSEVAQRGAAWAHRFGLLTTAHGAPLSRLEFAELAARVHPLAPPKLLQIAADWFTWLLLIDDMWDESVLGMRVEEVTATIARLTDILHGAPLTIDDGSFAWALHDLRGRLLTYDMPATWLRFTASTERHLAASLWEANNRRLGFVPTQRAYQRMRVDTSGVFPCLDLIGLIGGFELPDAVYGHPTVRRLALLTNRIICWCNDILSVDKERRNGEVHNLVLVLQYGERMTAKEALDKAIAVHNQDVKDFVELVATLPLGHPAVARELGRYVEGLQTWMRANYEFSRTAERYRAAPEVMPEARPEQWV